MNVKVLNVLNKLPVRVTGVIETSTTIWMRPSHNRLQNAEESGEELEDILYSGQREERLEVKYEGGPFFISESLGHPFTDLDYAVVQTELCTDGTGGFTLAKIYRPHKEHHA